MQDIRSIIICGVGGQGNVLATDIISSAIFLAGYDVKKCEIHGMSQRQGSVVGYVKFGEKVYSPVVSENEADFLIGFEKLESLRYLNFIKKNATVIVQNLEIPPISLIFGNEKYPENIEELFLQRTDNILLVETSEVLKELGNPKVFNTYIIGIFSIYLNEIEKKNWIKAIEDNVKKNFVEINIKAFELGRKYKN